MSKKKPAPLSEPTEKQQEILDHIERTWGKKSVATVQQKYVAAEIRKQLTPGDDAYNKNPGRLSAVDIKEFSALEPLLYLIENDDIENPLLTNLQRLRGDLNTEALLSVANGLSKNCTLPNVSIISNADFNILAIEAFRDTLKTNFILQGLSISRGFKKAFTASPFWKQIDKEIEVNKIISKNNHPLKLLAEKAKQYFSGPEAKEEVYTSAYTQAVKIYKKNADDTALRTLVTKAVKHTDAFPAFQKEREEIINRRREKRTPGSTPVGSWENTHAIPDHVGRTASSYKLRTSNTGNDESPGLSNIAGANALAGAPSAPIPIPDRVHSSPERQSCSAEERSWVEKAIYQKDNKSNFLEKI